jgi:hypothetical protein
MAHAFRYVFLDNDYLKDVQLFQYPLALQKLALFVMETYKRKRVNAKEKPLVMVVKNTKKGTSMIIGVMDYNRSSNYVKKYVKNLSLYKNIVILGKSSE